MRIEFTVPGTPVPKGRPRFSRYGTYTPKKTADYEKLVKACYLSKCKEIKLYGAISARIEAYFPIPKSTSKKNRLLMLLGKIFHTKRSDCDNIAKSILDALNKIAYDDDGQVCILYVRKRYSNVPRVEVGLEEIEEVEDL